MPRTAVKSNKIVLGKLAVGAVFEVANVDGVSEWWKVIGRPTRSGVNPDGKTAYWVPCTHVLKDKNDTGAPVPTKSFNLRQEVTLVRGGRKDYDAIDKRDQPGGITPLDKLTGEARDAAKLEIDADDKEKNLDGLTEDEELEGEE